MSASGIKSKPVYPGLAADPAARRHILVGEGPGAEALLRLSEALRGHGKPAEASAAPVTTLYTAGHEPDHANQLVHGSADAARIYSDTDALRQAVEDALADAPMGTRLYIAGSEPFLWMVALAAREAGLAEAAMQMERCGPAVRAVCCVHCKTTDPAVDKSIYQCPGCGLHLFVRDHFSRRLGVYQGVCVDAEAPGELPEAEELEP